MFTRTEYRKVIKTFRKEIGIELTMLSAAEASYLNLDIASLLARCFGRLSMIVIGMFLY